MHKGQNNIFIAYDTVFIVIVLSLSMLTDKFFVFGLFDNS